MPKPLIFLLIGVVWCVAVYTLGFGAAAYLPGAVVAIVALIAGGIWNSKSDRSGYADGGEG